MADAIVGRLLSPIDSETQQRKDIHLISTTETVIDTATGEILADRLDKMGIIVTKTKPAFPCLWGKEVEIEE